MKQRSLKKGRGHNNIKQLPLEDLTHYQREGCPTTTASTTSLKLL
jgi:hypothetical protein